MVDSTTYALTGDTQNRPTEVSDGHGSGNDRFRLLTGHLGIAAVKLHPAGTKKAELPHSPFGETRDMSNKMSPTSSW